MSELGNRIRARRAELGLTQKDLADACKVKQASVSAWERGDTLGVRPENLYLAARKLRTSMEWLATGRGAQKKSRIAETTASYHVGVQKIQGRCIPELADWDVSTINNANKKTVMNDIKSRVAIAKDVGSASFALRVSGDSMEPTFPQGCTIVVDPEYPASHGAYVVVEIEGEQDAIFKQLVMEGQHQYLRPLNTRYPVVEFDQSRFRICGVVRQMLMDFD